MRDLAGLGEITRDVLRKTFPQWRILVHAVAYREMSLPEAHG
jgi:hypothetical protein